MAATIAPKMQEFINRLQSFGWDLVREDDPIYEAKAVYKYLINPNPGPATIPMDYIGFHSETDLNDFITGMEERREEAQTWAKEFNQHVQWAVIQETWTDDRPVYSK